MISDHVLVLVKPTPGDDEFYARWRTVGPVLSGDFNHGNQIIGAIVVDFRTIVDDAFLDKYPFVKYVVSPTTGRSHLTADFESRKIKLITLRDAPILTDIRAVSQFVIHRMLDICNMQPVRSAFSHKTVGIIGIGRIGQHIAQAVAGMGATWFSCDAYDASREAEIALGCDFVTIHLSENNTTTRWLNRNRIALMKRGSALINTARPSIIDHEAVYDALQSGQIATFIHDFYGEVQWPGPELNTILEYPHIAGRTFEDRVATDKFVLSRLMDEMQKDRKEANAGYTLPLRRDEETSIV